MIVKRTHRKFRFDLKYEGQPLDATPILPVLDM